MDTVDSTPVTPLTPTWLRWVLRAGALVALATVFGMYLQPAFMMRLGDFIWSCFG